MDIAIRGRHLKYSVAKWKFGPCLFNTLRMVFQGTPFFYHFWSQGRSDAKEKLSLRWWEHRETGTLVQIGFQPSSSDSIPVPPKIQQVSSGPDSIWSGGNLSDFRRNWNGSEELGLNPIWTKVPVCLCSPDPGTEFLFSSNLPWDPKLTQKLLTFSDLP